MQCDSPIIGVALTDVNNQFSSLPFVPAVKAYNYTLTYFPVGEAPGTQTGELSMRVIGALLEVEAIQLTNNGQPVQKSPKYYSGTAIGETVQLFVVNSDSIQYFVLSPFSLSMGTVMGSGQVFDPISGTYLGSGQITLTATN
jgi:hypothetical protein